jgi:type 1 glutamine amidotransferase
MRSEKLTLAVTAAAAALLAGTVHGQVETGRGGAAASLFSALDADRNGSLGREEMRSGLERWFSQWDTAKAGTLSPDDVVAGLNRTLPPPPGVGYFRGPGGPMAQNQTPDPEHVKAMVAALPDKPGVKPKAQRRVLVLARAAGFVHSSIPLAARMVEEMGRKTGAWSTTITYDAADINEKNLRQYDAIFLASTTGAFLDDPNDAAATAARRKALLDFVRGGKGLAGIHAASDTYHQSARVAKEGRGGGGSGPGPFGSLARQLVTQGDTNADQRLSRDELVALADAWFTKLDAGKRGSVSGENFPQQFAAAIMPRPQPQKLGPTGFPIQGPAKQLEPDDEVGTWPEFNRMFGGFFKWHWNDGQPIPYKIDEPQHPLNAPFKGLKDFQIVDETYTFGRETYSRQNLRVLTSVDYDKMSAEDKAKEQNPRSDGDYALSWIRREGKGRVFYETHGHNEKVYAIRPLLEHVMLGIQYVLGDLQADDRPSVQGGTR